MLDQIKSLASHSAGGETIALIFGTSDFEALLTNWACHAKRIGVRWFALVAMDAQLHASLLRQPSLRDHAVLLQNIIGNVNITKLNVIGERQRFGLRVLEQGISVVHTDADALWLRDPTSLFDGGDVVAERIWGKPLSVVKDWGAGICTGFYYLRSTPAVKKLARSVREEITRKRKKQPNWQASDQFFVNILLHRYGVKWEGEKMAPMTDLATRFSDSTSNVGVARTPEGGRIRLKMLPHRVVPRACPVLSSSELQKVRSEASPLNAGGPSRLKGKARYWRGLLESAVALHCFPPGGDPLPGEKRFVFMGHPKHTQAEVNFARRQGLWMVDDERGGCVRE